MYLDLVIGIGENDIVWSNRFNKKMMSCLYHTHRSPGNHRRDGSRLDRPFVECYWYFKGLNLKLETYVT